MTIEWLPSWYVPGWPSAEDAVKALYRPVFPTGVAGAVRVVNELPDDEAGTGWTGRILFIARAGGATVSVRHDQAAMQIAAITDSRADSLILSGFVRDINTSIEDDEIEVELDNGTVATITEVLEIAGPEEVPGMEYDERIIPATYLVTFANPLETPDYSGYLGL